MRAYNEASLKTVLNFNISRTYQNSSLTPIPPSIPPKLPFKFDSNSVSEIVCENNLELLI